ncbi:hypothetical protein ALC57_05222 [Trachymyrmex cornetzi]|uniref:Uncharacterized protein n=1 Tax=Trachymyrmex cornetzi TaxID=471704 RepID=A0A151JBC4_9HYME|nr:hypothetical protein ALC57_05222 [Trachymyrmex cornetzi]
MDFTYESKIIPLPFVNNPPSSFDTIFTVLVQAASYSKKHEQTICFVTFDQPLWQKGREILGNVDPDNDPFNLSCIRLRLGGFHLVMSFLGAVGYIMDGSGLREAFLEIYAENSADKALSGHAYSRAIRGHFLVQLALTHIILSSMELTETDRAQLDALLLDVRKENFAQQLKTKECIDFRTKFIEHVNVLRKKGKTSQH